MATTEIVADREVELHHTEIEPIRVRVLPNGQMDSNNSAKYVNRAPKTLAMWRMQGIGPEWTKVGGRIFYKKEDLDRFLSGAEIRHEPESKTGKATDAHPDGGAPGDPIKPTPPPHRHRQRRERAKADPGDGAEAA